jgi:ABC-type phosphate transport system permease subunit
MMVTAQVFIPSIICGLFVLVAIVKRNERLAIVIGVSELFFHRWNHELTAARLSAIILAGGKSSRMGAAKIPIAI